MVTTRDRVIVTTGDNVRSRVLRAGLEEGAWRTAEVSLPGLGTACIAATSETEDLFF